MANITKRNENMYLKKNPNTTTKGKSRIPAPVSTITAIRKTKPTKNALIVLYSFLYNQALSDAI